MNSPIDRTPAPDLRQRGTFKSWLGVPLRYADLDTLGHVNNAFIPMAFEQARCELLHPLLKNQGRTSLDIVLAKTTIEYLKELTYPGHAEIGTILTRLGSKSFTLAHGVFQGTGSTCVGTGEAVIVTFDLKTRTSVPVPADIRAALERLWG